MKLVLAWLFVISALGWGVMKSVQKARPLFSAVAEKWSVV